MDIQILDNSDIDEKYWQKKDLLTHTILIPVMEIKEHNLKIYSARNNKELRQHYDETQIRKLDSIYADSISDKLAYIVKLGENYHQVALESGYLNEAIYCVFKDELLNSDPRINLCFEFIEPTDWIKEQLN